MNRDINQYMTIQPQKNGRVKITFNEENIINIYKLIHQFGYRKGKLNNKSIFFRREGINLTEILKVDILNAFYSFLKNLEFTNIPEGIEYSDIIDGYLKNNPICENKYFHYYLNDTLTEKEVHQFRLQSDVDYRLNFERHQLLSKFDEWSFRKTIDTSISFSGKNNPLYYKSIGNNKYLIFNHFNSKNKNIDGFDCFIASYKNENQIGIKLPIDIQTIRLSFQLERDFPLIKDYLLLNKTTL